MESGKKKGRKEKKNFLELTSLPLFSQMISDCGV